MTILQLPKTAGAEPVPQQIDTAARRRVSGPGLRTFLSIADRYGIPTRDRVTLLGEPSKSTYHEWVKKARAEAPLTLPLDTLTRISGILGIHKALGILFPVEAEAMTWLKGPHRGEVFGGQAPLAVMVEGGLDGILTVRRYLDGWRGGLRGGPGEGADIEPLSESDLVFT
ncbi:MAG: hypothetical protein CVT70_18915 [Alphaproteobacteria bacterium HGW-Alphaproteobacteria-1]|jgi:hypothetical protein|nr:MAG: hypothetical protein CVT70_18915 [Alphaproteobacteria bacterium HGW-Alphaproteobacteria-1]